MKLNPILILGIVIIVGGIGLAIYGTSIPYLYAYQDIITDKTQTYSNDLLQLGNSTSFSQTVSSGSWMEINVFSDEGGVMMEMRVTGSVSGQLYDAITNSVYDIISFHSNETISVEMRNPSSAYSTLISGTFTFEHWGMKTETRYYVEPFYWLAGGVLIGGGIIVAIYGVRVNRLRKVDTAVLARAFIS